MSQVAIPLTLMASICPYWDYLNHMSNHNCNGCDCMVVGNNIDNVALGVRIGHDRYCTIGADIRVSLLNVLSSINK